jgi:hypothetical protein
VCVFEKKVSHRSAALLACHHCVADQHRTVDATTTTTTRIAGRGSSQSSRSKVVEIFVPHVGRSCVHDGLLGLFEVVLRLRPWMAHWARGSKREHKKHSPESRKGTKTSQSHGLAAAAVIVAAEAVGQQPRADAILPMVRGKVGRLGEFTSGCHGPHGGGHPATLPRRPALLASLPLPLPAHLPGSHAHTAHSTQHQRHPSAAHHHHHLRPHYCTLD